MSSSSSRSLQGVRNISDKWATAQPLGRLAPMAAQELVTTLATTLPGSLVTQVGLRALRMVARPLPATTSAPRCKAPRLQTASTPAILGTRPCLALLRLATKDRPSELINNDSNLV